MLPLPGHIYIADAASNTLNLVHPNGSDEILAYLAPNVIADATATCIAQGPEGALYVGTLALVDSLVFGHAAVVYRVDPSQADASDMSKVLNMATRGPQDCGPSTDAPSVRTALFTLRN